MDSTQPPDTLAMDDTTPKDTPHHMLPLLPLSSGPPSATQTLIINYPAAKLSSSPASSPNIVEPSMERKGSVHPTLGKSMERGVSPGVDFFDDQSSGSEWEDADDEDKTQTFSEDGGVGLGLGSLVHSSGKQRRGSRGWSHEGNGLTALPPFEQELRRYTLEDSSHAGVNEGPKRARHVSLTPMEKTNVKIIHNHGSNASTPRGSIASNTTANTTTHFHESTDPYPIDGRTGAAVSQDLVQSRHRRNTSDSVIADSIINAHLTTMQALKVLSPSGSIPEISGHSLYSATTAELPKARSFSDTRHIRLSPISVKDRDNLPSHFVKTPYPFTAKKEFPKPATRPRHHNTDGRLDSGYGGEGSMNEYSDVKGKHVSSLMPSGGQYDLRSGLQRNAEAPKAFSIQGEDDDLHRRESVLYLALQKHEKMVNRRRARIIIPSDLATSSPDRRQNIDFDDKHLAECLRSAHNELAGSWVKRCLGARKLRYIRLSQTSAWSGSLPSSAEHEAGANRLLASGCGEDAEHAVFTEDKLMQLYKHPKSGKARYTWVHWARRVATTGQTLSRSRPHTSDSSHPLTYQESADAKEGSVIHHSLLSAPETILTVQFVHTLSTMRILVALALILATSVLGTLLWVFMGVGSGWMGDFGMQSANRVGSGMAVGMLVLLLDLLGFGAWVWRS